MRNKKIFFWPIFLCGLISCSGGPEHVTRNVTFNGENCFLKDSSGNEITTAKVDDNSSVNYVIFIKNAEDYELPSDVAVSGSISKYNYDNSNGTLSIENITSDITITAQAKKIDKFEVRCDYVPGCSWTEYPSKVKKNQGFSAKAVLEKDYILNKSGVIVINKNGLLKQDQFTFENNILTIDGEYVISNIVIYGKATPPTPPAETYQVNFSINHAHVDSTYPIPSSSPKGFILDGCFVVDEGYRAPTKDELAPPDHSLDGTIIKRAPGVVHPLTQDQFYYETYYIESVHKYGGYILIYDIEELSGKIESIDIGGEPVKLVTISYDVKEGHWQDGTRDIKTAIVDKGTELDKATQQCKAFASIDDTSKQFAGWFDKKTGQEVYSTTLIYEDIELEAHYRSKEFIVYTDGILGCDLANFPGEKTIKWHEPLGDKDPKPTITVKDQSKQLPFKSEVEVMMGQTTSKRRLSDTEFTYNLSSDKKSATFGINANVIEGDIHISLSPYEVITVKFNPDGGTWPSQSTKTAEWVGKPNLLSYSEIYAGLDTGGDPIKDGYIVDGWKDTNGNTIDFNIKPSHSIELKPNYITIEKANFTNDTWANVIKYANQGSTALDARYGETLQIGAERTIIYRNPTEQETLQYNVRLIGRNHDELADGSGKKAALTFEFSNLIYSGMYGHDDAPYHSSTPNNTWETSDYRKLLGEAYTALKECNPGFDVKTVNKKTMQGKDGDKDPNMIVTTQETLFPLSGSEMCIPKVNDDKYNQVKYNYSDQYEGSPYAYYLLGGYYVKTYKDSTDYSPYWLRSPHTEEEPEPTGNDDNFDRSRAYYIKGKEAEWSTKLGDYGKYTTDLGASYGYAAAFCI